MITRFPDITERSADRSVLPWRFVVGVLLHIVVPVYAVVLAAALVPGLGTPAWHPGAAAAHISMWFVPLYTLATVVTGVGAAWLDPWLRRRRKRRAARDPQAAAEASARRVAGALTAVDRLGCGDSTVVDAHVRLRDGAWRHDVRAYQTLSRHLAAAVAAFEPAIARADPVRRAELVALAGTALGQIAGELNRLNDAHAGAADVDAEVVARFTALRYGNADFAGDGLD